MDLPSYWEAHCIFSVISIDLYMAVKYCNHICYTAPRNAVRCSGLRTPRDYVGRLYPIRCGCSHCFDVWRLLVLAWDCYWHSEICCNLGTPPELFNSSSKTPRTSKDEFLRYFLSQSHSPFLTYAHKHNLHAQKNCVYRKQKQYCH